VRDSILAAPIVLDLALFFDFAGRAGLSGIQEWLSFYFKSPQFAAGLYAEHDLFIQADEAEEHAPLAEGEEQVHAPRIDTTNTRRSKAPPGDNPE